MSAKVSPEEVARALRFILDYDDRETWYRVGMALKAEFGDNGRQMWDGWSELSIKYQSGDQERAWRGFKSDGAITIGTLFQLAKDGGWTPSKNGTSRNGTAPKQTAADKQREAAEREQREERQLAAYEAVAAELKTIELRPASADHPYLTSKGIKPFGAYQIADGRLALPVRDISGKTWSFQYIDDDGKKLNHPGGRVGGCFVAILEKGDVEKFKKLVIAEGYATGMTIREATGLPVLCALSAGNLMAVAKALRKKFPDVMITIAADFDAEPKHKEGDNPGLKHAVEAMIAVEVNPENSKSEVAIPQWPDAPRKSCDWNDLHTKLGLEEVKRQYEDGGQQFQLLMDWIEEEQYAKEAAEKAAKAKPAIREPGDESENVIPANATTPEGKTGLPEPYSQSRLADIFDQRHADELRHVEDWNFYLWYNGARWLEKSDKIAIDFAENVAREASERALAEPPSYIKPREARAIGGRGTASAIAGLAANRRSFRSNPADWDQQPHLFNVANGTIDLQTGELRKHDRRDLLTKITNIEYSTTATATRWYEYLAQVFAGDIDLCAYVQRLVGYSLTGSQKEKLFVVCQGKQDTGKSIFREIMLALAGDYGQSAPLTLFLEKKHVETNNPEVARLRGMRIVVASESGEGRKFDHEKIKSLTGRETVTGCFKYANPFDFYPTDTKWLFTNYKPLVNWDDGGMWTRLKLLQFLVQFKVGDPAHEMDKGLLDALLKQLPGILAWAVEGAIEWYRDGLREPESVTKAVADYKAEVDTIQPCLDECFEKGPDFTVSATDAFKAFKDWAISTGESYCSQTKFGTQLGRKDFESKRDSKTGRIVWKGLKLRPEVRERLDRMADLFDKKKDDNHRQGRFE